MRCQLILVVFVSMVLAPASAAADIYKYKNENGDIVLTTEPRSDLELIEVIEESSPPERTDRKATKKRTRGSSKSAKKSTTPPDARPRSKSTINSDQTAYDDIISEASEAYSIPFTFIKAVIKIESNYNRHAVSHVGAMGLMQLMPGTAEDMGVTDAFDPRQNIFGGTKYLRMMANKYNGDINLVLSAYNAGPGNVDKFSGIPFESTRGYVQKVYRWYQRYQEQYGSE